MPTSDVTQLLIDLSDGDTSVVDELLPLVYDELRRLAQHHLQRERPDHTLQATALVHEAYLKLVNQDRAKWRNQAHFMAIASQAIRRILVDHARGRGRVKRGGDREQLSLDDTPTLAAEPSLDVVALDEALTRFAEEHPDKARVVELRFFGGLKNEEVAEVLGSVTTRTIERHWQFARAWLYRALSDDTAPGGEGTDDA